MEHAVIKTYSPSKPPSTTELKTTPLQDAEAALALLTEDQKQALIARACANELAKATEQAEARGYEHGFAKGEAAGQAEAKEALQIREEELRLLAVSLSSLLKDWSSADMDVKLAEEADCIAVLHKALSVLMIEHLQHKERVPGLVRDIAREYAEEHGVEIHLSLADFNAFEQCKIQLPEGINLKASSEFDVASYKIKSASGTLEFSLSQNYQSVTEIFQRLAGDPK